jgi:hypothetical protein
MKVTGAVSFCVPKQGYEISENNDNAIFIC